MPGMVLLVVFQFGMGFVDSSTGPLVSVVLYVCLGVSVVLMVAALLIALQDMGDRAEHEYWEERGGR